MARRRVGMTMAAVAATIGAVLASAGAAEAATGSSVSAGAVNVTSQTAGSPTSYTLQFTVASALPKGGTITVQAPKQTNFLSCSSSCGSTYSILVSGGNAATVGSAAASALTGSTTDNQLVLTLASSGIQAGDTVTVTTHNTSNTTIAGVYSLTEFTSADTTPAQSGNYSINPGPAAAIEVAGGDNQSAQVNTSFASPLIAEVDDAYGNPVPGVAVAFSAPATGPSATFNPADCTGGSSTTPNTNCSADTGSDGQAKVGIAATGTTGSYHVTASASTVNGTKATTFTLTNTAQAPSSVTPGSVTISGNQVGEAGVTYTAGFTASNAVPSGGTITLTFPDGTSLPAGSCVLLLGCSGYSVTYNGGPGVSVSAVATSKVAGPGDTSGSSTPNQVVLTLGPLGGIPAAGDTVSVTISGVTNPTLASGSYVADESTSADPGVVATATYVILAGPAVTLAGTSGSAQSAQVGSAFADPLVATAEDAYGNPVSGSPVTFVIGSSGGASATFGNGTNTETDKTAANGQVTTGQITANGTAGTYSVGAHFSDGSGAATYSLTNTSGSPAPSPGPGPAPTPGVAYSVTITGGDYQSATVTSPFANLLEVKVTDAYGSPVAGAPVTFTAPPSGPSGQFGTSGTTETVATDSNGTATAIQYLANTVAGAQQVSATDGGIGAIFDLTNTAGSPTGVKMVSGQNQSAAIDTAFAKPFVSEAVDRYGNPVPYASLLFGGPPSGPGGTFANGLTYEADIADAQGLATSSTFTANGVVGNYQLATGLSNSNYVLFDETNTYGGTTAAGGSGGGYWLAGADGLVQSYGDAGFYGSAFGAPLAKPVVGMAAAPGGNGYWLVASDGGVFNYGPGAAFHGSAGGIKLDQPIVGMAADPATGGYWLVAADGGVFSYDAPFYGSTGGIHLNKPIVGIAAAPGGNGYWLVASDGGVFAFGPGAGFYGSTGGIALNKPVVGMAAAPGGNGYWLVASDGGIFAFGPGAGFYGSTGGIALNKPVVGMAAAPGGNGYWLVASDGGIFSFGPGAPFHGSAPAGGAGVVGMAAD